VKAERPRARRLQFARVCCADDGACREA
jgi:hypothetical protein